MVSRNGWADILTVFEEKLRRKFGGDAAMSFLMKVEVKKKAGGLFKDIHAISNCSRPTKEVPITRSADK